MKHVKITCRFILIVMIFWLLAAGNIKAQNARIKIDIDRRNGDLNRNIYGNFVSNYHWEDGVVPKNERPARVELAWARLETNQFDTNEFVEYARRIGTEPYIAVNLGTETIQEAQQWVKYCNVKEGSYNAELIKKHRYSEQHNIKYRSLGNEMDGFWQTGHLNDTDEFYLGLAEQANKQKLNGSDIKAENVFGKTTVKTEKKQSVKFEKSWYVYPQVSGTFANNLKGQNR